MEMRIKIYTCNHPEFCLHQISADSEVLALQPNFPVNGQYKQEDENTNTWLRKAPPRPVSIEDVHFQATFSTFILQSSKTSPAIEQHVLSSLYIGDV